MALLEPRLVVRGRGSRTQKATSSASFPLRQARPGSRRRSRISRPFGRGGEVTEVPPTTCEGGHSRAPFGCIRP